MKDVDSFSSKLQRTLEKLGRENGLAPQPSQDPADADLHEFYVAQIGESLFKKRKEAALERLTSPDAIAENVKKVVIATKKSQMKETATLIAAQHFTLGLETRKPATKVNVDKIIHALQVKHGWTAQAVAKLIADATEQQEPAKTFRASPIRG